MVPEMRQYPYRNVQKSDMIISVSVIRYESELRATASAINRVSRPHTACCGHDEWQDRQKSKDARRCGQEQQAY